MAATLCHKTGALSIFEESGPAEASVIVLTACRAFLLLLLVGFFAPTSTLTFVCLLSQAHHETGLESRPLPYTPLPRGSRDAKNHKGNQETFRTKMEVLKINTNLW